MKACVGAEPHFSRSSQSASPSAKKSVGFGFGVEKSQARPPTGAYIGRSIIQSFPGGQAVQAPRFRPAGEITRSGREPRVAILLPLQNNSQGM